MLVQQIDPTIIVAVIGILAAVLPVGITYVFTKNKEVDLSIRQEKTKRYDTLIDALNMLVGNIDKKSLDEKDIREIINRFITGYNRASTYASDLVLERCNDLAVEIMSKREDNVGIKYCIIDIYEAIRMDINPKAKYHSLYAFWTLEEEDKSSGSPIK